MAAAVVDASIAAAWCFPDEGTDYTEAVLALAEEYGLTFYDAAYLSLAKEQHLPLATLDKQLLKAADPAGAQLFQP
jgi:predicted nucleic acid-binding protein